VRSRPSTSNTHIRGVLFCVVLLVQQQQLCIRCGFFRDAWCTCMQRGVLRAAHCAQRAPGARSCANSHAAAHEAQRVAAGSIRPACLAARCAHARISTNKEKVTEPEPQLLSVAWPGAASALGLESAPLPQMPAPSLPTPDARSRRNAVADAEAVFRDSDILRALRERSDANRDECAGLALLEALLRRGAWQLAHRLRSVVTGMRGGSPTNTAGGKPSWG
jgi:hypothetical protein